MKTRIVISSVMMISLNAFAYEPVETTTQGNISTVTGQTVGTDGAVVTAAGANYGQLEGTGDGNYEDYCSPYCNDDYQPAAPAAPAADAGAAGNGNANACPVEPMPDINSLLSGNGDIAPDDIDYYNRKALAMGQDGFMVKYAKSRGQNDVATLLQISGLDKDDANAQPDDVNIYVNQSPKGVDNSQLSNLQGLGVQNSVVYQAKANTLYNQYPPSATYSQTGYQGLTVCSALDSQSCLILVNSEAEDSVQDVVMHEAFHAGMIILQESIAADTNVDPNSDAGAAKADAALMISSVQSGDLSQTTDAVKNLFPLGLDDDPNAFVNHTEELLASCSESDNECDVFGVYAQVLKKAGMTDKEAADYRSMMESDPTLVYMNQTLNTAAAYYLQK